MLNRPLNTNDSFPIGTALPRIALCDYSGHPFQAQLGRELARRGHDVLHLHFAEFQTPKGRLERENGDPGCFAVEPVSLGRKFSKHSLLRRRWDEIAVGRQFAARVEAFAPDVVIGSNLPLDSLAQLMRSCSRAKRRFVFWQQDIYSIAIDRLLRKRFGVAGGLIGRHYRRVERWALETSDAVVTISPDFPGVLRREFGIAGRHVHVIENWAPLDEIAPLSRDNEWARTHGLLDKDVALYTGTLGMKHNPALLLKLARALEARGNAVLAVTSEGPAADWLAREGRGLPSLRVMPFQSYAIYGQVLASADVLVSILEPDAGIYSVPSKVLSYMCAGRAIVLYAPGENLASRVLVGSGAGQVVSDCHAFAGRVRSYLDDRARADAAGALGRMHAETHFGIGPIGDAFTQVIGDAMG